MANWDFCSRCNSGQHCCSHDSCNCEVSGLRDEIARLNNEMNNLQEIITLQEFVTQNSPEDILRTSGHTITSLQHFAQQNIQLKIQLQATVTLLREHIDGCFDMRCQDCREFSQICKYIEDNGLLK